MTVYYIKKWAIYYYICLEIVIGFVACIVLMNITIGTAKSISHREKRKKAQTVREILPQLLDDSKKILNESNTVSVNEVKIYLLNKDIYNFLKDSSDHIETKTYFNINRSLWVTNKNIAIDLDQETIDSEYAIVTKVGDNCYVSIRFDSICSEDNINPVTWFDD